MRRVSGFRGLGLRVSGFRGLGLRVSGFRGLGLRVSGFRGLGFRVSGFRIQGLRCRALPGVSMHLWVLNNGLKSQWPKPNSERLG